MTDSIFAGTLSLTGDIPDEPPAAPAAGSPFTTGRLFMQMPPLHFAPGTSWHGTPQFEPLPETVPSTSAGRVRAEAARLGIDYEAEVARTLNRMKNPSGNQAPGPYNRKSGPDPVKNASAYDLERAETLVQNQFRYLYGIT